MTLLSRVKGRTVYYRTAASSAILPSGFRSVSYAPCGAAIERAAERRWAEASGVAIGLDINTRSTGVSVVKADGKIVSAEVVDTSKTETSLEFGEQFRLHFAQLAKTLSEAGLTVSCIGVEDFMKHFAKGGFHTQGLFALSQAWTLAVYEAMRCYPSAPMIAATTNTARSQFGLLKIGASEGKDGTNNASAEEVEDEDLTFIPRKNSIKYLAVDSLSPILSQLWFDFRIVRKVGKQRERRKNSPIARLELTDSTLDVTDSVLVGRYAQHVTIANALFDDEASRRTFDPIFIRNHKAISTQALTKLLEENRLFVERNSALKVIDGDRKKNPLSKPSFSVAKEAQEYETKLKDKFRQIALPIAASVDPAFNEPRSHGEESSGTVSERRLL